MMFLLHFSSITGTYAKYSNKEVLAQLQAMLLQAHM